jgi:hypothetical protein
MRHLPSRPDEMYRTIGFLWEEFLGSCGLRWHPNILCKMCCSSQTWIHKIRQGRPEACTRLRIQYLILYTKTRGWDSSIRFWFYRTLEAIKLWAALKYQSDGRRISSKLSIPLRMLGSHANRLNTRWYSCRQ